MTPLRVVAVEGCIRLKNRVTAIGWHPDPYRHFDTGGVEQAESRCAAANRDLLEFVRPPRGLEARGTHRDPGRAPGRSPVSLVFDSPLPSGRPENDRVRVRVHDRAAGGASRKVVLFHHPIYQKRWWLWDWFLGEVKERVAVAMMAGPYHFERVPAGEYPGESVCNPNPWRLFEAIRQWCWDQQAMLRVLNGELGLRPAAVIGFSFGAFQSLLASAAGLLDVPIVSIASTNRYAYGVFHGVIGHGIRQGMLRVGIDEVRLARMTESIQLERHVPRLARRPVLYVDGVYDRVDPPPSLDRLLEALKPSRVLRLPAGHATTVLHRREIVAAILEFFEDHGVL